VTAGHAMSDTPTKTAGGDIADAPTLSGRPSWVLGDALMGFSRGSQNPTSRPKIVRLLAVMYEGVLIGLQFYGASHHQEAFTELADEIGSGRAPTNSAEEEVVWQEANIMLSLNWGAAPTLVILDTEAYAESQK
jgi:hypothetical protein